MTVIAWDGKTLAADKQGNLSGIISTLTKIKRHNNKLIGGCGNRSLVDEVIDCIIQEIDFPVRQLSKDEFVNIIVIEMGKIYLYGNGPKPILIEDKFFAIGCGSGFALAAMHCGKTAREAVEIACIYDNDCGCGIDELIEEK